MESKVAAGIPANELRAISEVWDAVQQRPGCNVCGTARNGLSVLKFGTKFVGCVRNERDIWEVLRHEDMELVQCPYDNRSAEMDGKIVFRIKPELVLEGRFWLKDGEPRWHIQSNAKNTASAETETLIDMLVRALT